jgi:hypothetical protein
MPLSRNNMILGKRLRLCPNIDDFSSELPLVRAVSGLPATPVCASKSFGVQVSDRISQSPMPKHAVHDFGMSPTLGGLPKMHIPFTSLPIFMESPAQSCARSDIAVLSDCLSDCRAS